MRPSGATSNVFIAPVPGTIRGSLTDIDGSAPGASGTLGYMPPEQLADEAVDERADQWAFAALVYRALTGVEPYPSDRVESALLAATREPPPLPSASVPRLAGSPDDTRCAFFPARSRC